MFKGFQKEKAENIYLQRRISFSKSSDLMADFKGLAWNCTGLRSSTPTSRSKAMYFEKEYGNDFDIAFFLETHHRNEDDIPREILRYQNTHHIIHSPVAEDETYAGIIGIIKNDYDIISTKHVIQGRILNIKIQHKNDGINYNISAVYLDTNNHITKAKMENIVMKLRLENENHPNNMILGDFNFIDHEKDKINGLNNVDKLACKIWQIILSEVDMIDPYREQNPKRRIWSFIGTGSAGNSRIDRLYVNFENMQNIKNIRYTQTPFGGHRVLCFTKKRQNDKGKGYYKMNTSILKDARYREIVEETINDVNGLNLDNDIERWETFLATIKAESISYSQTKNKVKRSLKDAIIKEIFNMEEEPLELTKIDKQAQYNYLKQKLKEIETREIEGYIRRIKYSAPYEKGEPDIAFYSKLEKRKISNDSIGQLAEEKDGEIYTDNENIIKIATKFYTDLYTPNKVNTRTQDRLLRNIKKKITQEQKEKLDAPILEEEIKTAVFQMQSGKSPGFDGIPIEFYQEYWNEIKHFYMAYINQVKTEAFSKSKNTSVVKIIYKKTGEIYLLTNYRPISLINVDIKILTKTLANRLKFILPTIIHASQTAVYGRKIDETIHMIRDLIDIANKEDEQAAFIFLDQEKAFDRVNHEFLYKTMRAFGIGEEFTQWISKIYSNATSVLNINGFLSKQIPLKRGVRQGCPLSALLYVLVIEVLAIQFRLNPNIVGFKIGGEKIVSAHYMDDATIIIKQNRCFKEVIKELTEYEEASGAKVNYEKTKGLWTGSWKDRRVPPMDIKWTNKNVKNLGVYFGNDDPASATFDEIVPDLNKRLNYWKQFKITQLGKARIVETFLASKLIYAMKFYPIPKNIQKSLQKSIFDYINFPQKNVTIAQKEMSKVKSQGGIKVINLQIKSETSKAKWLIEIATKPDLQTNLNIFTTLIGTQKGNISGRDIIFLQKSYFQNQLRTGTKFYKEALMAMTNIEIKKGIKDVQLWDREHLFYNPLFTRENGKLLSLTKYCGEKNIFILEQLLDEKVKENRQLPHDKVLTKMLSKILLNTSVPKEDILIKYNGEEIKFAQITQKQLYEEALIRISGDHFSQVKWVEKLNTSIVWEEVWKTVHNFFLTNKTKNIIWQQLHLNFYTQYSYNKWHKKQDNCPLCQKIPESIYHIILHCEFANKLWEELEPILRQLHPVPISDEEKAFGIVQKNQKTSIILRNWLTYLLRECISREEREAYYSPNPNLQKTKLKLNEAMRSEIHIKAILYKNENNLLAFEKVLTYEEILCKKGEDGEYQIMEVFS